jgi:uncharacterized membrane protein
MSNSHQDKFITKLLIGITLIIVSVFVLFFTIYERSEKAVKEEDWYWWAFAFAALQATGIILICSAYVHKTKSDFIRRQQQRDQDKSRSRD